MGRTVRKVPDEWEKFEAVGQIIGNTRIFAFKTPLRESLRNRIPKGQMFTTQDLFMNMVMSGRTLGLVINACFTERYYDKADIEGMMIGYKWIPCPTRNFIGRPELVKFFCKVIDEFLAENQDNDLLIGVNCSNGVNRSGYLICRYLIDRLGWSSHDALNAFEIARGYPIERGSFIQALHKADRERRLGRSELAEQEDISKAERKKRKRKGEAEIPGLDPALTAQVMQQFYQMEQQFKEAAGSAISDGTPGQTASPYDSSQLPVVGGAVSASNSPATSFQALNTTIVNGAATYTSTHQLNFSQTTVDSSLSINQAYESSATMDEDYGSPNDEASQDRVVDFESMGKVDVREISSSESRRNRRKRLDKQFQVMKRGRFWEINEMRQNKS